MNVCILLAAGTSSRCGTSKQMLFMRRTNKTVMETCIDTLLQAVDKIILVTNEDFTHKNRKVIIVPNKINCRLQSIKVGLDYINKNYSRVTNKIIIHDVARPFIRPCDIRGIIAKTDGYAQYCLKLTNGLIYKSTQTLNRDDYMELCTPICVDYKICKIICKEQVPCEFIDSLITLKLPYTLIPHYYQYLRKITTLDDVF